MDAYDIKPLLRRTGFKATPARIAMLAVIRRSKKPLSAQEIIDKLAGKCDQATVYRFMSKLKKSGIIRQIDLRHNHAHFEFVDMDDHHHLICTRCGRIEDITGCGVEDIYGSILKSSGNFSEILQHSLEFYGVCNKCTQNERQENLIKS